ncbi:MAG: hypothetical protein ACJ77M_10680 [Thermoleophilaceae bacterium]
MQDSAARRRRTQPEHDVARPRTFTRERELSVAATTPDWLLPDQESPGPRGPSRAATAWAEGRTPLRAAPNPNRRTVTITGQTVAPRRRPSPSAASRIGPRPDRIAGWAVLLGLFLVFVAEATAHAAPL